jgi:hypothetical protein
MTPRISRRLIAAATVAAAIAAPAAAVAAEPTVNWQINLKPSAAYPRATGGAQYQSQPGQRELQIEVEHIAALKGQTVTACVNGEALGSTTVSKRGIAQVSRNTEIHQAVPVVIHGTTVSLSTGATCAGSTIMQGAF